MATVTDFTARLLHGSDEINLSGTPYCIANGFIPPSVSLVPLIATGTSANVISGGTKRGIRAVDRSLFLPIEVTGSSEKEVRIRAGVLASFLQRGTEQNPVIFELRTNSDIEFLPSWGQDGSAFRFEIIHAGVPTISQPEYMLNDNRTLAVFVDTDVLIKPYATGLQQELALAQGGIVEDTVGTVDGTSRGTIIPEATTNKVTNPIFGNATPLLNWGVLGDAVATANTNKEFVLFGFNSAKVTGAPPGDSRFRITINVSNTNDHFLTAYVKRPDGAEVTSADVSLLYDVTLTTNYISEGDGWYRLTAAVTGIAAGTRTGIAVQNGHTVYLDGVQLEEKEIVTPLCHGDLLGCSWSGTDHNSTSTRLQGEFDAPVIRDIAEGYVRVVWRAGNSNVDLAVPADVRQIFDDDDFELRFRPTQADWLFTDGTTSLDTSVTSFAVNDVIILHVVWGPSGLALYLDGVLEDSDATYTPVASAAVTIGTRTDHMRHSNGTFLDFTVGDREITSAEVTDDHKNVVKAVEDGVRLMPIPYFWTKDGDGILDTGDTSTTDNWGIIGGIAGSAEADTVYRVDPEPTDNHYWLIKSSFDYGEFLEPTSPIWFYNKTGTADGNANGGSALTLTVGSPSTDSGPIQNPDLLVGTLNLFFRARHLGGGGSVTYEITPRVSFGGSNILFGKTKIVSVLGLFDTYFLGSIILSPFSSFLTQSELELKVGLAMVDTNTGAPTDLLMDYQMAVNGPFLRMTLEGVPFVFDIIINGTDASNIDSTLEDLFQTEGVTVEPSPDKSNIIWFFSEDRDLITETFTFDFIKITPRWYLL